MIHTAHDIVIICTMNQPTRLSTLQVITLTKIYRSSAFLPMWTSSPEWRDNCLLYSLQLLCLCNLLWKVQASLLGSLARNWKKQMDKVSKVGIHVCEVALWEWRRKQNLLPWFGYYMQQQKISIPHKHVCPFVCASRNLKAAGASQWIHLIVHKSSSQSWLNVKGLVQNWTVDKSSSWTEQFISKH